MKEKFNENEFDTTMDALMSLIQKMPKATVKMFNLPRYMLLMKTASQLTDLLRENILEGELNIEIDDTFNFGAISVELDMLTVESPQRFTEIVCHADNFEIYPLTNGKIRLDITFHGVLKNLA